MVPDKNSTAACLWMLMLTLDADGKRKDVEFDEIQGCLSDLTTALGEDPGRHPEALMAALNSYYAEIEKRDFDDLLEAMLHQIDDSDLRQQMYVMLVRVAISDRQFHSEEDTLLRRIGEAWGLDFKNS